MLHLPLFVSKKGHLLLRVVGMFGIALVLLLGILAINAHPAHASGGGADIYVHTATSANTHGDATLLDNPVSNNNPAAIVFVTANWNPGGIHRGFDNHQVGVRYDARAGKWSIFNEDRAALPLGSAFNVYVLPGVSVNTVFIQTVSASNTSHNATLIDSVGLNGNPAANFLVTQNWNPGGQGGVFNNHAIGVRYDAAAGKWAIFNEDHHPLASGAAFNVVSMVGVTDALKQVVTSSNSVDDATCINSPVLNGNAQALAFITQVGGDDDFAGVFAVRYQAGAGRWSIFNSAHHHLEPGSAFFVTPSLQFP